MLPFTKLFKCRNKEVGVFFGLMLFALCVFILSVATIDAGHFNFKYYDISNLEEEKWIRMKGSLVADDPFVVEHLQRNILISPSTKPYNLSTDPDYKKRAVGYTWGFVDDILKTLFEKTKFGFFVEAGGLDGEFLSNTLRLEQTQNWTGLLVEPEKRNFQDLVNKRRKCWIAQSCLSREKHPREVVMTATEKKPGDSILDAEATRGGTHEVGSFVDESSFRYYYFLEKFLISTNFKAQCFPLQSFLIALDILTIDFLSLDLQGSEMDVFDTIPLDMVYVRTVVIEHETPDFDNAFAKKMNKKGFYLIAVGGSPDYFFVNAKEKELIKLFREKTYKKKGDDIQEIIDEGYEISFTKTGMKAQRLETEEEEKSRKKNKHVSNTSSGST